MPGPIYREGERVELRPVETEDADFVQELINDARIRHDLGAIDPINGAQEEEWIENIGENDGVNLLITADGDPVGTINLRPLNETWGTGEVSYMIAPDEWGQGYATDALRELCAHAFEYRRIGKLVGRAYVSNESSCRVLEKVGFREEGVLRKEAFVAGERVDVRRYGLSADEWDYDGA